jgi:DNA-directed RNA polymerase specialized sigma24 family protein
MAVEDSSNNLIAINEALTKLAQEDHVVAEVVKLRYFAGFTLDQAAEILCISPRTAARYWAYGRVWLLREIT